MRYQLACFLYAVFFVLLLPSSASAALVAQWKFDDGSGSAPVDSSGNSITGAFFKGSTGGSAYPTWSTDVPPVQFSDPYSLSFTGLQDAVKIDWPSGRNFSSGAARSFSFWYKPTANGETAAGNYDRLLSWTSDQFDISGTLGNVAVHRIAFQQDGWHDTGYDLTLNSWQLITVACGSGVVKLYVGTSEKFSGSYACPSLSGSIYIGLRFTGDEGINGLIDDVRVYDTALTVDQISNLSGGSSDPDVAPDTAPPAISAIATSTTSSSATVTWTTDEAASTKIAYSSDTSYASSTSESDTGSRVTSHSKSITSLLSCTSYNFKAASADAAGNYATSTAGSFTTTGCAGGAIPSSATTTTVMVSTAATSTITDSGRTLSVSTPANLTATSSSVVIQIKGMSASTVLGSIGKPSSSLSSAASIAFDVTALIDNTTTLDSFNSPVTISYTYTDADVSGLDESSLTMYHYHNGSWLQLDNCAVDTAANKITCTVPSFSTFAIFGVAQSSSGHSPHKSGDSIQSQVVNLIDMGKIAEANALKAQWYWLFPQTVQAVVVLPVRDLQTGMTGEDVTMLQKFLNTNGFMLAVAGPGAPGSETALFGALTRAALAKFQAAHGIAPAMGYFGPITRAKLGLNGTWW